MTRVVIVGAGLLGSAVAHRLAERGVAVIVAEANRPAAGTSGSSFAWVNAQDKAPDDYAALNEAGVRSYPELAAQIGGDWYHPGGDLVFGVGAGAAAVSDRIARHEERDYPVRRLDRAGALGLEPDLALPADGDLVAGHFPDEAWIDVPGLVGRLLRAARSRGAVLDADGPIDTVVVDSGRVGGVRSATGRTIAADAVVLAAGPQTEALAARIGMSIPMAPTPGLLAVSRPVAARIDRIVHGGGIAMRPDGGGRIMLSSRTVDAALDPTVTEARTIDEPALDLLTRGARLLPELATAGLESARIGYRSVPADGMPAVGFAPGIEGLYVLVSHSGVTLGPILGTIVAAELLGSLDPRLEPYRPARFAAAVG